MGVGNSILDRIPEREWKGLDPSFVNGRFHLTAKCSEEGCRAEKSWTARTVFDPKGAVARVHKAGWSTGKAVICPACISQKKEKTVMKPVPIVPVANPAPLPLTQPTTAQASDAARIAKRLIIAALEDHYDDVSKRYRPNRSDASIAKETGCAEAVVAKLREEFFGPVGEPEEVSELRREFAAINAERIAASARIEADFREASKRYKERLSEMELLSMRAENVVAKIDALAIKNGWKQ